MHDGFGSSTRNWKAQYKYTSGPDLPAANTDASSTFPHYTNAPEGYPQLFNSGYGTLSHNCLMCGCRRLWRSARPMGVKGDHICGSDAADLLIGVGCGVRFSMGDLKDCGNTGVPSLVSWPSSDGSR